MKDIKQIKPEIIDLIEKHPKLSKKEIAHGLTLKKKARAWLNRKK